MINKVVRHNLTFAAIAGLLLTAAHFAGAQTTSGAAAMRQGRALYDQTVVVHNPYTGRELAAQISSPPHAGPAVGVVVFAEDTDNGRSVARQLSWELVRRGMVVMRVFERNIEGDVEGTELSALAALGYLRTLKQVRDRQVGLVGYGAAVPAIAAAAEQPQTAVFAALLGGRIHTQESAPAPTGQRKGDTAARKQTFECPTLFLVGERDSEGGRVTSENLTAWKQRTVNDKANRLTIRILADHDRQLQMNGGRGASSLQSDEISITALRTSCGWIAQQAKSAENVVWSESDHPPIVRIRSNQPTVRVAGVGITFEFPYHPWYVWRPAVGGQERPYGDWYW